MEKGLEYLFITLSCSHFFNKTDFEPAAYAGFSKGGGRKFENNEDQKKGLHSDLARFSAQV